jgi:hypothetical protein
MRFLAVLSLSIAALAIPLQADLVVGTPADPGSGNCYPFGCDYSGEYQQVYTSSLFSSPITITGLEFFNTQASMGATSLNSGTFTVSLSTTSADWDTLSTTFASNIGGDNTTVFSGDWGQSWAGGDTLVINFATPFSYAPSAGNLLMDVNVAGASGGDGVYFDTNGFNFGDFGGNSIMGRVYENSGCPDGCTDSGYGLVTGFETDPSDTPEPASLLLVGIGATAFLLTRRKRLC